MGEAAKPFWVVEEEPAEQPAVAEMEDITLLSTGVSDESWKFGSD